jgi:cytochrome c
MFDTMTITKAGGAACGALLIFLMGSWAAESIYRVGGKHHGAEDEHFGYEIAMDEGGEAAAEGEAAVDFTALVAAADVAAGEKVFSKCKTCHKLDGTDGTGPHLNGIVGKAKAASGGFGYSDALKAMAADTWTPDNLNAFLTNPKKYAPGTKMSFAGLPDVADRANLVAWLATSAP